MKKMLLLIVLFCILLSAGVFAKCTRPFYSADLNYSTKLCGENFVLPAGLVISRDNVFIDCGSAVLKGNLLAESRGFLIEDRKNVKIKNCRIVNYPVGILVRNSSNIILEDITFLRNRIGLHVIDSVNVNVKRSFDISLERPVRISNSHNNAFLYLNKKIKGDFCAYNNC